MNATTLQCRKVPRMWQRRIPKEIAKVMAARKKPRYLGSLGREEREVIGISTSFI
jgi:hypothetical protein